MIAGRIMGRRSSNGERSRRTVELLQLSPGSSVLEIGYGPGVGLEAAARAVGEGGEVVGIDHSVTMRRMASRRLRRSRLATGVDLRVGDITAELPTDLGTFDAVFSCNVWLFWPDQVATLRARRSLVRPGGTMAVTLRPRTPHPTRQTTIDAGRLITDQLEEAGYTDIATHVIELGDIPATCVIARNHPT